MIPREVIRCPHCGINQFMPLNLICRRCKKLLHEPVSAVQPSPIVVAPVIDPETLYELADVFRANVLALRRRRGWSQRNFAEKIGVRRTWISKIENGHCTPMLPSIQKIAEAFDVAPHALLVPPKEL